METQAVSLKKQEPFRETQERSGEIPGSTIEDYRRGAEKGNADAQYHLALCYEKGQDVPQDFPEALRLYRLAADQGNVKALFRLGLFYYSGKGVK